MGLAELFAAVLLAGISAINAAIPIGAYARLRDGRFLLIGASSAGLALLGGLWTWGSLPYHPPAWADPSLPVELLVLVVALFLLAATLWPRHA